MRRMSRTILPDLSFMLDMPRQRHFLFRLLPTLQRQQWCSAIWLSGFAARGKGDRWSTLSLHLLTADARPGDTKDRLLPLLHAQVEQGWSHFFASEASTFEGRSQGSIRGLTGLFALEDTTRGAVHFEIHWTVPAQLVAGLGRHRPQRLLFAADDLPAATLRLLESTLPALAPPDVVGVEASLAHFWELLSYLPAALNRCEWLAAARLLENSRQVLIDLVIALNGAGRPPSPARINPYLGPAQLEAFEKTLPIPQPDSGAWIGQAVALIVLYRWYAPQLVEIHSLAYPDLLERTTLALLSAEVDGWPAMIQTG
jgi:hypothetical protein